MSDEIDEITNRSSGPRSTLGVYGRQDSEPAVVLLLRFNRGDGVIDTIRLAHSPAEARRVPGGGIIPPADERFTVFIDPNPFRRF